MAEDEDIRRARQARLLATQLAEQRETPVSEQGLQTLGAVQRFRQAEAADDHQRPGASDERGGHRRVERGDQAAADVRRRRRGGGRAPAQHDHQRAAR